MPATILPPLNEIEIRFCVEPDLQKQATQILADCGLEIADAIRLFLHQVVNQNGLPFEVKKPNAVTLTAIKEAEFGDLPQFESVQELFDELAEVDKG